MLWLLPGVAIAYGRVAMKVLQNQGRLPQHSKWPTAVFLAPAVLIMLLIYGFPLLFNIIISFTNWTGIGWDMQFVGFNNYTNIFTNKDTFTVLGNNVKFLVGTVVLQNVFALWLSTWLVQKFRGRNFFRSVFFMPVLMPVVAVAMIFGIMLDPLNGPIAYFAQSIGWDWLANMRFLGDPKIVMQTLVMVNVWQWTGWNIVVYLAGHQAIPQEIYESSALDGASGWTKFRYITLPMLAPSITINIVLTTMGALKVFDLPYALTKGGPGNYSTTLTMEIVRNTGMLNKAGLAAAISIVLAAIIIAVTFAQNKVLSKQEEAVRE